MMDGFFRRLVRNAGWGLGFVWVDFLVGLATTTITARALGASDFGRVALVTAAVAVEALVGRPSSRR
jgi:O-antigen/teichoic acid export membrane protein